MADYQPSNSANMISQGTEIKEGDTNTQFKIQLLDVSGDPVDLTDATAKLYFANQSDKLLLLQKNGIISSTPTDGTVTFQFSDDDATGNGIINIQINIINSNGDVEKFPSTGYSTINITPSIDNLENVQLSTYTIQQVIDHLTDSFSTSIVNTKNELNNNLNTHKKDKNNPHQVTKEQLGLGSVDNTTDVDKPVSTPQLQAIQHIDNKISLLSHHF